MISRQTPSFSLRHLPQAAALSTLLGAFCSSTVNAQEISLLSGFYRSEETDNTGTDGGKKSTISLGARYSDHITARLHWFGEGELILRNYGKNAAGVAPSNSSGLIVGGGVRHYFGKLGDHFATYATAGGRYKSEKDGKYVGNSASTTEVNGLYYGAGFGMRLYLGSQFFCDFEVPFFESALFATETVTTETSAGGNVTKTDVETKKTELYISSSGLLSQTIVSLGMKI
jgi:hypothetical protein